MKKIFLATSFVIVSQFAFAQEKSLSPFTSLKVFDNINVKLVPSTSYKSDTQGDNVDDIEFVNTGDELKVRMKTAKVLQGNKTTVTLYYKEINSLQVSQGARITSDKTLKANKLNLVCNEGGNINLDVDVSVLDTKINTGGKIEITGKANSQTAVINTGGDYSAKNLKTDIASISITAGGNASVYAKKSIDAKVKAGGNINVYGNPKTQNNKTFAGGKINYKD